MICLADQSKVSVLIGYNLIGYKNKEVYHGTIESSNESSGSIYNHIDGFDAVFIHRM